MRLADSGRGSQLSRGAAGADSGPHLRLTGVTKYYRGNPRPALRQVSLEVARGDVLALLGESGSGKTTLLRLVAGFEQPSAGTISLAGSVVSSARRSVPPEERAVGVVFQDTALLPHLTIRQNVAFGLRRLPERRRRAVADQTLQLVHAADVGDRYPHEVSGGQAQRAAIGRALAPRPALLLLDEPFNNLDPVLKWELFRELRAVLQQTATTALFVTHDRDEAFTVADRLALLRRGRLVQAGDAETLYREPANAFAARYLGAVNLLPAQRRGGVWVCALGAVAAAAPFQVAGAPAVPIRPWQLRIGPAGDGGGGGDGGGAAGIRGTICGQRFMGEYRALRVRVDETPGVTELIVHVPAEQHYAPGQPVRVTLAAGCPTGGRRQAAP